MTTRGRPRTAIGTFGNIRVTDLGGRYRALTRYRDLDGRLRRVVATARSRRAAEALLKERLAPDGLRDRRAAQPGQPVRRPGRPVAGRPGAARDRGQHQGQLP